MIQKRKHRLNKDGYVVVSLCNPSKDKWRSVAVHRLIAIAFIPNPLNKSDVNHKDFNRQNFNINNLEWLNHDENIRYSRDHFSICKIGNKNARAIKINIYKNDEFIKSFDTIKECCLYIKDKYSKDSKYESIYSSIKYYFQGKRKSYKGFTFKKC